MDDLSITAVTEVHALTTTVWGIAGAPRARLDLDQATRSDDMTVD